MDIREQIEWWKRAEKKRCVDSCPYWSELSGFLYTVEAMLEVVTAASELTGEHDSDCDTIVRGPEATARWFPDCDCSMQGLKDALDKLKEMDVR